MLIGNQVNASMVGWVSRNRARDSSIEDVAPDWGDNFSFLRRGNLHSARFEGDFQVLSGRKEIILDTGNKVVMLNVPQALGIAQICG